MKAVTVYFRKYTRSEDEQKDRYYIMHNVLIHSWRKHANIPMEVHRINPPEYGRRDKSFYDNHEKLRHWIDSVDQDTVLIDCDMLCIGDISEGFKAVKHIGITDRQGKIPYNGGVVFVRSTPEAKAFLKKWLEIDEKMLRDSEFHDPYKKKYAGLNQSSMGWMIENGYDHIVTVLPEKYNCVEPWTVTDDTRLIHIKGVLRRNVFRNKPKPELESIVSMWREYAD